MGTTADKLNEVGIEVICERVANCETLRVIAESYGMSKGSLLAWIGADSTRSDQYARAREAQAEQFAEEIIEIADNVGSVLMVGDGEERMPLIVDGKPVMIVTSEAVAHGRLQVDARKWLAGKMSPKKYGDSQRVELSGSLDVAGEIGRARKRSGR